MTYRIASVGVGGQGWLNLRAVARIATVTALCDIDRVALRRAAATYPQAQPFESCDALFAAADSFDAVVISIPDHSHAAIASQVIAAGKHCYCEKPLTSDAKGLREILQSLQRSESVTCLGCQGVYSGRFEYLLRYLDKLDLDSLREVVVWTDRPGAHWSPTPARLSVSATSDADIAWRLWSLSPPPVEMRALHPMAWRAYRGFGTGPIGDMGSHLLALPILSFGFSDATDARVIRSKGGSRLEFADSLELQALLVGSGRAVPMRWLHGEFAPTYEFFTTLRRAENGLVLAFNDRYIYCPEWNTANAFEIRQERIIRLLDSTDIDNVSDIFNCWLAACHTRNRLRTSFNGFGSALTRILLTLISADKITA